MKFDEKVVRCSLSVFFTEEMVDRLMSQFIEDQEIEDYIKECAEA